MPSIFKPRCEHACVHRAPSNWASLCRIRRPILSSPRALCTAVTPTVNCYSHRVNHATARKTAVFATKAESNIPARDYEVSSADVQEVVLNTVLVKGQKAYWLAPENEPEKVKGVVLFLHGFSQGPKAYALLYRQLVAKNLLVVAPAPEPLISPSTKVVQTAIVESAAFFRQLLQDNAFPGLQLADPAACRNIGLLGHSVGAGLATYVSYKAAADNQPFKAVMYMAAQTQVERDFSPASALDSWSQLPPAAKQGTFALQYGDADLIAPAMLSKELATELKQLQPEKQSVQTYILGTHTGFQDQLLLGDLEVDQDVLPYAALLLMLLTAAIASGILTTDPTPLIRWILGNKLKSVKRSLKGTEAESCTPRELLGLPSRSAEGWDDSSFAQMTSTGLSAGEKALLLLQLAQPEVDNMAKSEQKRASSLTAPVQSSEAVTILAPGVALNRYITLLLFPAGGLFTVSTIAARVTEGGWHWLWTVVSVLTGFLTVAGAVAVLVQVYVMNVQRPESRVKAAEYFNKVL